MNLLLNFLKVFSILSYLLIVSKVNFCLKVIKFSDRRSAENEKKIFTIIDLKTHRVCNTKKNKYLCNLAAGQVSITNWKLILI